jgi:multimeric flavodoxin WrbA
MNILGIAGSPRRGCNTETILDEMLKGAASAGANTEKIVLAEMNMNPCKACSECAKTRVCVQKDDMASIVEKMERSEVWVLVSPVYWWGPTAQMKIFVDRWYSVRRDMFKGKRIIFVVTLADKEPSANLMLKTFESIFNYLGMETYKVLIKYEATSTTKAKEDKTLMNEAFKAGSDAVKTLKF